MITDWAELISKLDLGVAQWKVASAVRSVLNYVVTNLEDRCVTKHQ